MATNTTNLGLRKPAKADYVNVVTDIDDNMDLIDSAVNNVEGVERITLITVADDTVTIPQGLRIYDEEDRLLDLLGGDEDDGLYTYRSGQVELTKKACAVSGGIIYSVAFTMLILNLIFDTAFFGLSLRGRHSIYTAVVSHESIVSVLVYFAGVFVVLLLGYLYGKLLQKYTRPIE